MSATGGSRADEDSPPFVNVFFELFFELGRDLFDMGTLSPYLEIGHL